jgi:ubiquinone/menaquinone biosynthesis C-methylase UbiE
MPIDFHAQENRFTYALRKADPSWEATIEEIVSVKEKIVGDIGCGGRIYSRALSEMGAANVIGVDFSEQMLKTAWEQSQEYANIQYVHADACRTDLPGDMFDVVLLRALIHHLDQSNWSACFAEAHRLLKSDGVLIVQDRTPEDCLLPGSATHIRGYYFERYPKL